MDYTTIANSPLMWLACGCGVALVLFQAAVMVYKSLKMGKQLGVTDTQIKAAVGSSVTASLGPSLAILAGMVSLLVVMGGPVSWFRLSYIGNVSYELMAAGFGADAVGVMLGSPEYNGVAFACGLWVMTLGSIIYLLFTALATPKLDKFQNVLAGGRKELVPIVASAAMCGAFSYLTLDRVMQFKPHITSAAIGGFVSMGLMTYYNKKANKKWIREWSFFISMIVGVAVSMFFM